MESSTERLVEVKIKIGHPLLSPHLQIQSFYHKRQAGWSGMIYPW